MLGKRFATLLYIGICFLMLNSAYVAAYAEPTLFYVTNVFAHLAAGALVGCALLWVAWRKRREQPLLSIIAFLDVLLALISGGLILYFGGTRPYAVLVLLHGVLATGAILAVIFAWRAWFGGDEENRLTWKRLAAIGAAGLVFFLGAFGWQKTHPDPERRFVQQLDPPLEMAGEGLGEHSPFFPSAAETNTKDLIPADFFTKSYACGQAGCHKDIYNQWN